MSVLSIVEVEGPLPRVVEALQKLQQPPKNRRTRAQWAGQVAMLKIGSATGTAFWLERERVTVLNIHDRNEAGVAESVVKHLDDVLPYEVSTALRFVA